MYYELKQYCWRSGRNDCTWMHESTDHLLCEDLNYLDRYALCAGSVVLAEFKGCDVELVRAWLDDNSG